MGWHRGISQFYYFFPFTNGKELVSNLNNDSTFLCGLASTSRTQGTESNSVPGHTHRKNLLSPKRLSAWLVILGSTSKNFSKVTGNYLVRQDHPGPPHPAAEPHSAAWEQSPCPRRSLEKKV